jgi:RHS repeat-associated protein
MTIAGQPQVSYTYDTADRLTQITQQTSHVNFSYDNDNRRVSLTLPNGVSANYAYDNNSRITAVTYNFGASTLGNLTYTYDHLGRRTQTGGSFARTNLPGTVTSASYDAANELTNWNGTAISYDANGNMLFDGSHSFTWNARDEVTTVNGVGFQYDALGRRTKNLVGTSFIFDAENAGQEFSGSSVTANIWTGDLDEVFRRSDSNGTVFPITDLLGSVIALTDSAGNIVTSYTYDPFGNTTTAGAISSNPTQYAGRENEGNGLYFYRNRYYSPQLGRFVSEDPVQAGGNFYIYAEDDPIDWVDPLGLAVAAPGFGESLIPIWGSGRQSIHDFQCGHYVWGTINAALAISDVFLVKSLFSAAAKVGVEGLVKVGGSHTWDATRTWMTREGWRDFPGQNFHHWAIPQGGWGEAVPDVIKNQPWNIMRMTAEDHTALHQMEGAARVLNGTPTWAKVAAADAAGKAANLAGRSCGCD